MWDIARKSLFAVKSVDPTTARTFVHVLASYFLRIFIAFDGGIF